MDREFRVARSWSNAELLQIGHLFAGDIVNVSAGENIDKEGRHYDDYFPNSKSFSLTNHAPGAYRGFEGRANEYLVDLREDLPGDLKGRFDVVFNHTVLEHVFDVRKAFSILCQLSRDVVIVVVPFAQVQHDSPGYADYWRLCPAGVRALYEENGLEVVYESVNRDEDAAVYLFFIGAKHPDRLRDQMPAYAEIEDAGSWIGRKRPQFGPVRRIKTWVQRVNARLKRRISL